MLPPFVPPSARVPSESLPLITEFVIERMSHVTATTSAAASAPPIARTEAPTLPPMVHVEDVSSLPSIEEFLMKPHSNGQSAPGGELTAASEPAHGQDESASRPTDEPVSGIAPQALEREEGEPTPRADTVLMPTPVSPDASEVKESTPPGARFNDEAGDAMAEAPGITMSEAWGASAVSPAVAGEEAATRAHAEDEHDHWAEAPAESAAAANDAAWVAEERDSFDWHGVDKIAAGPDERQRAEEAWSGTDWEPRKNPEHEQVATALVQLARRVRAGEVKVELPPNATVEASLAAVLAALLADEER